MRLLKFIVTDQRIEKDPECDFKHIVSGSRNYLKAHFSLSKEWQSCILVASFWRGDKEHAVRVNNGCCDIPVEVLDYPTFRVSLTGQSGNTRITTNRILIRQEAHR